MTTPIRFAGYVPEELLTPEARNELDGTAERQRKIALEQERRRVILSGDLSKLETAELIAAANDTLEADPNDKQVRIMVRAAFKNLTARASAPGFDDFGSLAHRELPYLVSHTMDVATLTAVADMSVAALVRMKGRVESSPEVGTIQRFAGCIHRYLEVLHAASPGLVDDYERVLCVQAPGYTTSRAATWEVDYPRCKGAVPMTKEFARMALAVAQNDDQRFQVAMRCDLDWLTPAERALVLPSALGNPDQLATFTSATMDEAVSLLKSVTSVTTEKRCPPNANIAFLPRVHEIAANFDVAAPLFREPWLRASENRHYTYASHLTSLMTLAPLPVAVRLFKEFMTATVAEYKAIASTARPESTAKAAWHVVHELLYIYPNLVSRAKETSGGAGADIFDAMRKGLFEMRVEFNLSAPFCGLDATRGSQEYDFALRKFRDYEGMTAESVAFRAALIDASFLSLDMVRQSDLRKDVIGPALERNPARLAEITDLEQFLATARRFKIPVELPETVQEAARMAAAMETAISETRAGDKLANVEAAPRRTARKARA